MGAYSTRLATGTAVVASNRVLAFTVPAGNRVVIRQVSLQQSPGAGVAFLLYLGSGGPFLLRAELPQGSGSFLNIECRTVYHEGEQCYARALVNNADFSLHGYILKGPGGPMTPTTLPA